MKIGRSGFSPSSSSGRNTLGPNVSGQPQSKSKRVKDEETPAKPPPELKAEFHVPVESELLTVQVPKPDTLAAPKAPGNLDYTKLNFSLFWHDDADNQSQFVSLLRRLQGWTFPQKDNDGVKHQTDSVKTIASALLNATDYTQFAKSLMSFNEMISIWSAYPIRANETQDDGDKAIARFFDTCSDLNALMIDILGDV